jgi:hypothetical protein
MYSIIKNLVPIARGPIGHFEGCHPPQATLLSAVKGAHKGLVRSLLERRYVGYRTLLARLVDSRQPGRLLGVHIRCPIAILSEGHLQTAIWN